MAASVNWIDRAISYLAPRAGLRRLRSRAAAEILARHYEGAATGRRTQGWKRNIGDANAVVGVALARLRDAARDLVRNNGHAESALTTICDHVVGWGIVAKPRPRNKKVEDLWKAWAGTTACDAEGQEDLAGLQKLVMRAVAESGEVLVRRRLRLPEDGLPIPLQLQVLEPDYLDTAKTGLRLPNGGRIVHGIELDAIGRRVAYWLFREHPGSALFPMGSIDPSPQTFAGASVRVPAESVLHVFRRDRPGQMRGPSWFAPVLLKFKDFDEFDDATLMKQKIAACLSVVTSDVEGSAPPLGKVEDEEGEVDSLEPGMILNAPPGRSITVVQPPTVREFGEYSRTTLRMIATGLGVSYEDLTGDYSAVNFSSARMARLRHWARVEDWRWRIVIPQFCVPVWGWAMQAAAIMGAVREVPAAQWTAPPMPMIEPDKEGLAYQRNVRTGIQSLSEALRERGYDPEEVLQEIADDNAILDRLKLILDSDPRNTTQAGLPRVTQTAAPAPSPPSDGAADTTVGTGE